MIVVNSIYANSSIISLDIFAIREQVQVVKINIVGLLCSISEVIISGMPGNILKNLKIDFMDTFGTIVWGAFLCSIAVYLTILYIKARHAGKEMEEEEAAAKERLLSKENQ